MTPTAYRIERDAVSMSRFGAWVFTLFAVAVLVSIAVGGTGARFLSVMAVCAAFFCSFAFVGFRVGYWPELYAVEISDRGVRQLSSDTRADWSAVVRLRERRVQHRVELMTTDGPTGIALEYQLEGFHEALTHVMRRVSGPSPGTATTFRRRWTIDHTMIIALSMPLAGIGVWTWYARGDWGGPLMVAMIVALVVLEQRNKIAEVSAAEGFVNVRRVLGRSSRIAIDDVESIRIALRPHGSGHLYLDVFLDLRRESIPIRPEGMDPFVMFASLKGALDLVDSDATNAEPGRSE